MKAVQEGIFLSVCPSHKYKTNMLMIKFMTPYNEHRAAYQNLLASLLEDGSLLIQSRSELEQRLAYLYGANLGVSVRRQGNYLEFTLLSSIVRNDLLPQAVNLTDEWLELIQDLICNQAFDDRMAERFQREKALLLQKRHRQKDDKQRQAGVRLFERLYEGKGSDAFGSQGSLATLEQATLVDMANEYRYLLGEAQLHIILHGVGNEAELTQWISSWQLPPRHVEIDYHQNYLERLALPFEVWEEETVGEQTNLMLAYSFPPALTMERILIAATANALFGVLPTSELFMSIREQKSLTYQIMSAIDFQRHLVLVSAGVANDKGELVMAEIQASLQHLMQTLDERQLEQAKMSLFNYEVQNRDLQETELIQVFSKQMLPKFDLSLANYQAILERITVQDIVACLQTWQPIGCYLLKGGA
ncbi:insulinase family protein [Aerococcaceae bacterium NML210727]|nr:insulinase family protein [Aerococcaceae bacterium NML210727]MCW6654948.1 insulinase family protein [Aerococcaceae bacterium NML201296]